MLNMGVIRYIVHAFAESTQVNVAHSLTLCCGGYYFSVHVPYKYA